MIERATGDVSYFEFLVKRTESLVRKENYEKIIHGVLFTNHNGRSVWDKDVDGIFRNPQTNHERKLADRMTRVINSSIDFLLDSATPTNDIWEYMDLEAAAVLLYRLGESAPQEKIDLTRDLLEASLAKCVPEEGSLSISALQLLNKVDKNREIIVLDASLESKSFKGREVFGFDKI